MRRARGFSLVELMVAITLGLLVTGAVIATFSGVKSTSGHTSGIAAMADTGRIALDVIQQAVRGAGFMACNNTQRQRVELGGAGPTPLTYDFVEPLSGYEFVGTSPGDDYALAAAPVVDTTLGDWATTATLGNSLDPSVTAVGGGSPVAGSDALAVKGTWAPVATVYTTAPSGASSIQVNSVTGFGAGQLAIVSDCAHSVVDQIASVAGTTITFSNPLVLSFGTIGGGAQVAVADNVVFFVGQGAGAGADSALYSYSLAGAAAFDTQAAALVPNVESMQILYGVDTNGSFKPAQYVTADQVPNVAAANPQCPTDDVSFNCVVSIKVALLVASPLSTVPKPAAAKQYNLLGTMVTAPLDTRARQVFETTISLRNSVD